MKASSLAAVIVLSPALALAQQVGKVDTPANAGPPSVGAYFEHEGRIIFVKDFIHSFDTSFPILASAKPTVYNTFDGNLVPFQHSGRPGDPGGAPLEGGGFAIWTRYGQGDNYTLAGNPFGETTLHASGSLQPGTQVTREIIASQFYLPGRYSEFRGRAEAARTDAHIRWLDGYSSKLTDRAGRLSEAQSVYHTSTVLPSINATLSGMTALDKVVSQSADRLKTERIAASDSQPASRIPVPDIVDIGSPGVRALVARVETPGSRPAERWKNLKPLWRIATQRLTRLSSSDEAAVRQLFRDHFDSQGLLNERGLGTLASGIGRRLRTTLSEPEGREIRLRLNDELSLVADPNAGSTAKKRAWGRIGMLLAADDAYGADALDTADSLLVMSREFDAAEVPRAVYAMITGVDRNADFVQITAHLLNGLEKLEASADKSEAAPLRFDSPLHGEIEITPALIRGARTVRETHLLGGQLDAVGKSESRRFRSRWPQNVIDFAKAAGEHPVGPGERLRTRAELLAYLRDGRPGNDPVRQLVEELRLPDTPVWKPLLGFHPPETVQDAVRKQGKDWAVHRIEDASGNLNLDYFSVHIDKLPRMNGKEMNADELLFHIRTHLNNFVDTGTAEFHPLDNDQKKAWESAKPTGSIVRITMKKWGFKPDTGCVVVSRNSNSEWVFSTIRAGSPLKMGTAAAHPVSGNRAFGYFRAADGGYVFYTIGADRPTRFVDDFFSEWVVFPAADRLWKSLQKNIIEFTNRNEGRAKIGETRSSREQRFNWETIRNSDYYDTSGSSRWK